MDKSLIDKIKNSSMVGNRPNKTIINIKKNVVYVHIDIVFSEPYLHDHQQNVREKKNLTIRD